MTQRMPALFVGHGSPMNAIEDNQYTKGWNRIGAELPRPNAILAVSAHWYTKGTRITDAPKPRMVYDMYGFPERLYQVQYQPDGAPALAHETKRMIARPVEIDNSWGIDHGTWSVLCHIFPQCDIPVYQLSVDAAADARTHFEIGRSLAQLRERGVMLIGSGNVVHNLSKVNWGADSGYDWAEEFDTHIKDRIQARAYEDVIAYQKFGQAAALSVPTPDHFYPLLYVLGAVSDSDQATVINDACTMGSLSMTCYLFK